MDFIARHSLALLIPIALPILFVAWVIRAFVRGKPSPPPHDLSSSSETPAPSATMPPNER